MSTTHDPNPYLVEAFYVPPPAPEEHGPPPGSAEWLLNVIAQHANAEATTLAQYEHLAAASGDPVVALVTRLILEDEERHHTLLKRIQASLRDVLEWTHSPQALPSGAAPSTTTSPDLAALARGLVSEERHGAQQMRRLAESEKQVGGGLHALLLDMMAIDSDKHAHLLQFVEHRLKGSKRH